MAIRTSEEAPYTVVSDYGDDIQIRLYSPMIVAETAVEANYETSGSIAFKRLADYIFGNNIQEENITMTIPVFRENSATNIGNDNKWLMSFVMPTKYNLTNLPTPVENNVLINQIQAKKVAVLRYSGSLTVERFTEKSQALSDWLTKHQFRQLSKARSAAYDPPWTLPALRRNEVHIEIE